jgi:Cu-Zn family superoxide dismutase
MTCVYNESAGYKHNDYTEKIMRFTGITLILFLCSMAAGAAESSVEVHAIDSNGIGQLLGTVTLKDTSTGIELAPALRGLPPGLHGLHIHENPACGPGDKEGKTLAGLAAGSHYDPDKTGKHLGPEGKGHKGDLPVLSVAPDGSATTPFKSGRLSLSDVQGRSLIIHAETDNYADQPGGARIACGVIR